MSKHEGKEKLQSNNEHGNESNKESSCNHNEYLDLHQIATRVDYSSVVLHTLASTFIIMVQ